MPTKLAVLFADGGHSILQDLLDATRMKALDAEIAVVVADAADAVGLSRLKKAGVPVHVHPPAADDEFVRTLQRHKPSFIVLAAWPHALGDALLTAFPYRILDVAPGLPDQPTDVAEIFAAFQRGDLRETGVTAYFVTDDETIGPTILSMPVMLYGRDELENFERRVQQVEPQVVVRALQRLTEGDEG